jgi:SPP1 family predicted phage head-tail adaptor
LNPGILRHAITIQYKAAVSPTRNNIGEVDYAWATFHSTRARIRALKAKEQVAADAEESQVDTEILIRYFPGITAGMRVVHSTTYYDIRGVLDFEERKREITLQCTRGNAHG